MRTIILGLDGTTRSDRALERAAAIAEVFASKLIIVLVDEISATAALSTIPDAAMFPAAVPEQAWSRELQIEQARSLLDARSIPFEVLSPVGEAGSEIVAVADEYDADLIVVRAAGGGFLERWLLGSITDSIVRSAHRDVLLVADDRADE